MDFQSKELILLTGAGFTKNFGGFLAKEMWSKIFNNRLVQESSRLHRIFRRNFDFESAYSNVINDPKISHDDREKMKQAVFEAYKRLDDAVRGWVFNSDSPYPVNWYGLNKMIKLFSGSGDRKGFFFTLNQDLFMERQSGFHSPGSPRFAQEFYRPRTDLAPENFVTLEGAGVEEKAKSDIQNHAGLIYVKLHGSYGWRSSSGDNQLVVGKNKSGLIEREPLLKWYFDLFEYVIKQGNRKMLVIGYGFRDDHINKILLDGVQNYDLRIFILSTESPEDLHSRIQSGYYYALPVLEGLRGYFPHALQEVFPANQQETVHFQEIKEALLRH